MQHSSGQEIVIHRHAPKFEDFDDLIAPVQQRIAELEGASDLRCVYVNPEVSILARAQSKRFFREADKRRRQWCIRAKRTLGRNWVKTQRFLLRQKEINKDDAYWITAVASSGLLIVDHKLIHPDRWKRELFSHDRIR